MFTVERPDVTINDAHCHFFSRGFFEALAREKSRTAAVAAGDVVTQLGWDEPGTPDTLADRWVQELDRYEVSRAALIASIPGDEGSVSTAVARHPTRFVGFFMVNPTLPGTPETVARALDQGLSVVCLFPSMHRYGLDDERVKRIAQQVASRAGTALFIHCGVLSVGVRKKLGLPSRFDLRLGHPLAVQPLASEFPDLPMILPHFGAGFFREALMAADMAPNLYFDTSSSNGWTRYHPSLTLTDVFRQTLALVGSRRVLFGTDSSFFPRGWQHDIWQSQKRILDELGVDASAQADIFGGNFNRLFGSDGNHF